jgi:hypothetical protein
LGNDPAPFVGRSRRPHCALFLSSQPQRQPQQRTRLLRSRINIDVIVVYSILTSSHNRSSATLGKLHRIGAAVLPKLLKLFSLEQPGFGLRPLEVEQDCRAPFVNSRFACLKQFGCSSWRMSLLLILVSFIPMVVNGKYPTLPLSTCLQCPSTGTSLIPCAREHTVSLYIHWAVCQRMAAICCGTKRAVIPKSVLHRSPLLILPWARMWLKAEVNATHGH